MEVLLCDLHEKVDTMPSHKGSYSSANASGYTAAAFSARVDPGFL